MSENSNLDLEQDERIRVWIEIRDMIKADETLGRVLQKTYAWDDGEWLARADVATSLCPMLVIWPVIGAQSWYDPSSFGGYLEIKVRIAVNSPYLIDVLALWGAIERVLYPRDRDKRLAIERRLCDAGATTGQVLMSSPANDQDPMNSPEGTYVANGSMRIEIRRQLDI